MKNNLNNLKHLGQSIWLDFIDRSILADGTLNKLIRQQGLAGLTSNPAIFEKAITHDRAYTDEIQHMKQNNLDASSMYTKLMLEDIARAADIFLPVYEASNGRDGYVSIEVSPLLARDTEASIAEAAELWESLNRPNIMIKIPGTEEGLLAIETLLIGGININVTLLFSVPRYTRVLETYMHALEYRKAKGLPVNNVTSVASFFLSRIDVNIDALLDKMVQQNPAAQALRGRAAIASAALAYQHYQEVIQSKRWQTLTEDGAMVQRLLWASTGTKDPSYSDVKYVEALIAEDTVNTLPLETLGAYAEHGEPMLRIDQSISDAQQVLSQLDDMEIDIAQVTHELEKEGIQNLSSLIKKSYQHSIV